MKINADAGRNADDRAEIEIIANSGNDRAILKLLRDETVLVVLMVRVANQEERDEWEEKHEEDKSDEGNLFQPEKWNTEKKSED